MAALDAIFLPTIEPAALLGLELHLLDTASVAGLTPTLIVHSVPRPAIALARYHLHAPRPKAGSLEVFHRLTGGRAAGAGPGWIWIAIIASDANTIGRGHGTARGAEQFINRHVRGILAAMRAMGIDCFYPGRDAITSKGREIAMASFECNRSGAILFEAALAITRGMTEFIAELDSASCSGVTCPFYDDRNSTTVAREIGRAPTFDEVARAIASGYAGSRGANLRSLSAEERAAAARRASEPGAFTALGRTPAPALDRTARLASQLGAIEAHVALDASGAIARAMFAGEFIANSAGVEALERALEGVAFEPAAIERAVSGVLAADNNYFLGLGAPDECARSLARMIAQAR